MTKLSARGLTLIEVLVALVVMGTAGAIAWPAFRSAQEQKAVRSAADEFVLRHSMARSIALRRGRLVELHIDAAAGRFWVEVDTSALRTGVRDTVGPVLDVTDELGVTVTSTRNLLCFDGRGLATLAAGCSPGDATVVFKRAGYVDSVTTTSLGKVLR